MDNCAIHRSISVSLFYHKIVLECNYIHKLNDLNREPSFAADLGRCF